MKSLKITFLVIVLVFVNISLAEQNSSKSSEANVSQVTKTPKKSEVMSAQKPSQANELFETCSVENTKKTSCGTGEKNKDSGTKNKNKNKKNASEQKVQNEP